MTGHCTCKTSYNLEVIGGLGIPYIYGILNYHLLIVWEHTQGKANICCRRLNYVDMLGKYTGLLEK